MDRMGRTMAGWRTLVTLVALTVCAPLAVAQKEDFGLGGGLGLKVPGFGDDTAGVTVSATLSEDAAKPGEAVLAIKVETSGKSNTYGVDKTSPYLTKLTLKSNAGLTPLGNLTADHEPKVSFDKNFNKEVGKYTGEVTFLQRFQIEAGKTGELKAAGTLKFLFCDEANCTPKTEAVTASFTRTAEAAAAAPAPAAVVGKPEEVPPPAETVASTPAYKPNALSCGYQVAPKFRGLEADAGDPVMAMLMLCPEGAKAGETVTMTITLALKDTWHTYSIREGENLFGQPTTIEFDKIEGLEAVGGLKESPEPVVKKVETQSPQGAPVTQDA